MPSNQVALVSPSELTLRNIDSAQWSTLTNSLYPGANPASILMAVDYCRARKLDPMKKPCHIVPIRTKNPRTDKWEWRDVVMPGIYEYRTTAQRSGQYMGRSRFEYGPPIEAFGVTAPEWVEVTIYRWHPASSTRVEFPTRVYFREVCGTRKDFDNGGAIVANDRWAKAPVQMTEKCCEAAALRAAFPDELGGEHVVEEIEGRTFDTLPESASHQPPPPDEQQPEVIEGEVVDASPPRPITEGQLKVLLKKLEASGKQPADCAAHFGVAELSALPFDCLNEAIAWAKSNGA